MYSVQCIVQCTVYSVQCTVYSVEGEVCNVQCGVQCAEVFRRGWLLCPVYRVCHCSRPPPSTLHPPPVHCWPRTGPVMEGSRERRAPPSATPSPVRGVAPCDQNGARGAGARLANGGPAARPKDDILLPTQDYQLGSPRSRSGGRRDKHQQRALASVYSFLCKVYNCHLIENGANEIILVLCTIVHGLCW